MKKKKKSTEVDTAVAGQPSDATEQVNKYGTYNIQPTNDSDNEYPAIAQGISEKSLKERRRDEIGKPPA
ncbi:MAG: hypothetical protein IJ408_01510 [Clostridia bacterium]|nr:hypothetical protein [Clostridia bacterium]